MSITDVLKEQLAGGFGADISTAQIVLTLSITLIIGVYLFIVYRFITENAFYSKNFNISMVAMAVVTAGIVMAMQSSIVISLGMVGALSIVRFRTAIKEPMDLLFLFWSIGTGIICGAGVYKVAVVLAIVVTLVIVILKLIPETPAGKVLFVVCSDAKNAEGKINNILKSGCKAYKLKSRNYGKDGVDLIYEVSLKDEAALMEKLRKESYITNLSLVSHDGEFRG